MAKHRAPRKPFWTILGVGTIAAGLTVASLVPLPTVHDTAAQVVVAPRGGVAVGDGSTLQATADTADLFDVREWAGADCTTDAECAQWSYDHGWPYGYGTDESKVSDRSKPYGWAAKGYDLTHEDTGNTACWVEKAHSVYDAEMICGDKGDRPQADTVDIGEVFAENDGCGWVITGVPSGEDIDGGLEYDPEPASCN